MFCKHDRIFDEECKQCVSPKQSSPPDLPIIKETTDFNCSGRKMGKYADTTDCQKYHICLPRSRASMGIAFNQIVLLCPKGTAYNSLSQECDAAARAECPDMAVDYDGAAEDEPDLESVPCEPGIRKVDTSQIDCSGYTVCTEKRLISVRCPQNHRFDESQRKCRPAALVDC